MRIVCSSFSFFLTSRQGSLPLSLITINKIPGFFCFCFVFNFYPDTRCDDISTSDSKTLNTNYQISSKHSGRSLELHPHRAISIRRLNSHYTLRRLFSLWRVSRVRAYMYWSQILNVVQPCWTKMSEFILSRYENMIYYVCRLFPSALELPPSQPCTPAKGVKCVATRLGAL